LKALVLHGPGDYRVENDWPDPQVMPGWARIRVRCAGICGSDLPRFAVTGSYHHPMILGHEFSGVMDIPAPGSDRFEPGQPVAVLPIIPCGDCAGCAEGGPFHCSNYQFLGSRNDGGFAEYCLVPEENLFALPPQLDLRVGAFIEPIAVALHVLRRSGFGAGQSAIVYGAGAIGILAALWIKIFGAARVAVADLRPESLEAARSVGLEEVVDARTLGVPADGGFDAAFEAAGSAAALLSAIETVRSLGRITVVGRDTKDTVIPLSSFERLMRKEIDLRGCWGYDLRGEEGFVREMFRRGSFPVTKLISHEISLEEAPEMIRRMAAREIYFSKVMVKL
jgi:L-iditol 2-dehydrogenase